MDFVGHSANGLGIANAAILTNLFDSLVGRGLLTHDDVQFILRKSAGDVLPIGNLRAGADALRFIEKLVSEHLNYGVSK